MFSNLFLTRNTPLEKVRVRYYMVEGDIDPKTFYKVAKSLETRLLRRGYSATTWGDKVIIASLEGAGARQRIGEFSFALSEEVLKLIPLKHSAALSKLVSNALKQRAYSLGYLGPEGQKFFKEDAFRDEFFAFHDAFSYQTEVFKDGRVGIWLDPTTRWKQSLPIYLKWAVDSNLTRSEVREYLVGKYVYCPSVRSGRYKAEIRNVAFKPINSFEINVNGVKTTVYNYWTKFSEEHILWLKREGIRLDPKESPVITVQIPKVPVRPSFPPSLLELIIDLEDSVIPEDVLREKKILDPKARIEETFHLFDQLITIPLTIGDLQLEFERKLIEWTSSLGRHYASTLPLAAPVLIFGNNGLCKAPSPWRDPPIKECLQRSGPFTKRDKIPVSLVVPQELEQGASKVIEHINRHAAQLKLAKFVPDAVVPVDRSHPDRYQRICRNLARDKRDQIIIVTLPQKMISKAYYSAKRGLGAYQTKSQMLRWRTFKVISSWDGRSAGKMMIPCINNIAVQIYDKYLKTGESIWHLANPAGGLDPNRVVYFMGFDVSRAPERRKEAAAYAAVCDSYGRILYRKAIDSHKGEKIQAKVLSDWFFDVASSTYDEVRENKVLNELILYKDGPIHGDQIVDYRKGSLSAKERLMAEGIMDQDSNIRTISVIKSGPHRIYGKKRFDYKTQNTAVIRDPQNAIFVTSPAYQGTPSPMRMKIEFQIIEDMEIRQILRVFNDLRYLDWSSLYKQPKTILPLHIVQNLAKLSKEDVVIPYVPR